MYSPHSQENINVPSSQQGEGTHSRGFVSAQMRNLMIKTKAPNVSAQGAVTRTQIRAYKQRRFLMVLGLAAADAMPGKDPIPAS